MEYKRILTNEEVLILQHDLLDITSWIDAAILGKINSCKKRAAITYREQLKAAGADLVPANDDVAVRLLFQTKNYQNRVQREQIALGETELDGISKS